MLDSYFSIGFLTPEYSPMQVRLAVIFASVQLQVTVHIAGAICFLRTSPATGAKLRGWNFRVLPVLEVRWSLDVASPS